MNKRGLPLTMMYTMFAHHKFENYLKKLIK